jgi:hypothetical protein
MKALALALVATLFVGQAARPVTLLSEVREAIAAHDLARAESLVAKRRAEQGTTPEVIEAISWLGRGALAERQLDRAEKHAIEAYTLAVSALATRPVDSDAKLATAIGAGMEVQAHVSAAQGARSEAVSYLQRELDKYRHTSLVKRIQKNINLLSLEGVAAPALDLSETIGRRRPEADATKGKVVVLFFWAQEPGTHPGEPAGEVPGRRPHDRRADPALRLRRRRPASVTRRRAALHRGDPRPVLQLSRR